MERIEAGMFARSKAGRDKGNVYIIERLEGEYAYLTDGKHRPLGRSKRKNLKHMQIIRRIPENWNSGTVTDDDVKRALRQYERESAQTII